MRFFPTVFSFILLLTEPAFAHGGHVGELAGHTHWIGLAAIAGAAALAVWARKRKRRDTNKASDDASTADDENKAQG